MTNDTVRQLEESIKINQAALDLNAALQRLTVNRDFVQVIQKGYLEQESIRLVHLKADPAFQTPERQASIVRQIDAIGQLLGYFRTIEFAADSAGRNIESAEADLEELQAEGI